MNKYKEMSRRKEKGFTIVELLIVIVVIAILAALVIASYMGIQQRARDAERQSDIRNIAVAVQAYATINEGQYPTCAQIQDGSTVENIDPEALIPPNPATPAWVTGNSTAPGNYGCASDGNGVILSYTQEQNNEVVTREMGDTSGL